MQEIKSWDTVFVVKAFDHNVGVRVYYEVDPEKCAIWYNGHTKEFGINRIEYADNPKKDHTTTYFYEFKVVVGKPYHKEADGKKLACMDIKVEAIQKTELKNESICSLYSEFLDDGKKHSATVSTECDMATNIDHDKIPT